MMPAGFALSRRMRAALRAAADSVMILRVRRLFACAALCLVPLACVALQTGQQPSSPAQAPAPQADQPRQPSTAQKVLPLIVLDPGHGGTDTGARGSGGTTEKDVVLQFARVARSEFERLGFRVVMTRSDDSDPSDDDRAAIANASANAIYLTIHAGSTGALGTARAYYGQFSSSPAASAGSSLVPWRHAQDSYSNASHRLADLIQVELDRQFSGSPASSTGAAVRDLRSVAAPAVAVEVSTMSVTDPTPLLAMAGPLAVALTRAVADFHQAPLAPAAAGKP